MAATPPPTNRRARRLQLGRGFDRRAPRNPRAIAVAVLVHLVVAVVLVRTISVNTAFRRYLGLADAPGVQEQLTFVQAAPPAVAAVVEPPRPRDPGVVADRNAASRGPELAPPSAPVAAPIRFVEAGDTVGGRVLSAEGAAVYGLKPGGDPRLWTPADVESLQRALRSASMYGGVPGARELDSVITVTLLAAKDSLDSLNVLRSWGPTTASWTRKDASGGTWGMDASGIRLGKVTIPSALLALLPAGVQQSMGFAGGNMTAMDRSRQLAAAQSDIARFRESGPGNDMFKSLVDELRERRDREREVRRRLNARAAAEAAAAAAANGERPPPVR
jgi:hypothetical protein